MRAEEVPPGIYVKKKWGANVVIASRALCHRPNLPGLVPTVASLFHGVNGTKE